MKRTIQRLIQDPLAVKILEGEFKEGDRIKIDSDGDGLIFSHHGATGSDEGGHKRRSIDRRFYQNPGKKHSSRANAGAQGTSAVGLYLQEET